VYTVYVEQHEKHIADIRESRDLLALWNAYKGKYPYAADIKYLAIIDCLAGMFA
jgi:hypothetical protein